MRAGQRGKTVWRGRVHVSDAHKTDLQTAGVALLVRNEEMRLVERWRGSRPIGD